MTGRPGPPSQSEESRRKLAELTASRPYDGRYVRLCENRGGWHYAGLFGVCTRVSEDGRFLALVVEEDPEGRWPAGTEVIAEIDHETVPAFFGKAGS